MLGTSGSKLLTAPGAVTSAGTPTRVWAIHILSGGSAGVVSLKNGGSGDTVYVKETGTASTGKTIPYGQEGVLFPNGVYLAEDTAPTSTLVQYSIEK